MSKENKSQKKRKKAKPGDIVVIPLPNGKYAFGRIFKDCAVAYYKKISDSIDDIPDTEDYQFIVHTHEDIWEVVAHRPYSSEEEVTSPPSSMYSIVTKKFSTYYNGKIRPSSLEECKDLEPCAVWAREHIIDRLMGDNKSIENSPVTEAIRQYSQ